MAVVLDVALSGPRSYHGERRDFPFVHPEGRRDPGPAEIEAACGALWRVWGALLVLAVFLS
jgi:adenosylcobinamide-phosphate synthase